MVANMVPQIKMLHQPDQHTAWAANEPNAYKLDKLRYIADSNEGFLERRLRSSTFIEPDKEEVSSARRVQDTTTAIQRTAVFLDVEAMKQKIRNDMVKPEYDVCNFYWSTGIWQEIARSGIFEKVTMGVISFNALWISIDTDWNDAQVFFQADAVFQLAEHFFCVYFSLEWTIRFFAFKNKKHCFCDAWFLFDSALVTFMVAEVWVMNIYLLVSGNVHSTGFNASLLRMARLLRLSRMARMARLFRAMPELLILIKGMVAATRSVFFTLLLIAILIYIFAILFAQLTSGYPSGDQFFPSVRLGMITLMNQGTLLDNPSDVVMALGADGYAFAGLFYLFSILAAWMVLNMLIGVLCEVVTAVAAAEKEKITVAYVKAQLEKVIHESGLDADKNGKISKAEFAKLFDFPVACRALEEVGVDVIGLIDSIDLIFQPAQWDDEEQEEPTLKFEEFLEIVLAIRGSNKATVKDITDLRKFIAKSHKQLRDELRGNCRTVAATPEMRCTSPAVGLEVSVGKSVEEMRCTATTSERRPLTQQRKDLVESLATAQRFLTRFMESLPPPEAHQADKLKDVHVQMCHLQDAMSAGMSVLSKARLWMGSLMDVSTDLS